MADSDLLKAALNYARCGLLVFPVHSVKGGRCACGKSDCDSPGKHPATRHGFKDGTRDERTIRAWWSKAPYNIGIATGAISGIVVLDIDPRNGGRESLRSMIKSNGRLPETRTSRTGGGGWHLFYKHTGRAVPNLTLADGLEIKGEGSSVVAPPSLHQSGERYKWIKTVKLARLPQSLESVVRRSASRSARHTAKQIALAAAEAKGAPDGLRGTTLARLIGMWFTQGFTEDRAMAKALSYAGMCTPPMEIDRARSTVRSVFERADRRRSNEQRIMLLVSGHRLSAGQRQVLLSLMWLWRDLGMSGLTLDAPYRMVARYSGVQLKNIRACLATLAHARFIRLEKPQRRAVSGRVFYPTRVTFINALAALLTAEL